MLHNNINFEWRWNHWPLIGNAGIAKVSVGDTKSPEATACLSSDSEHFQPPNKLSILITLSTDDKSRRRNETTKDQAFQDEILPHLNHATIAVAKRNGGKLDNHLWFNIFLLTKALASRSPLLMSLRIVAQESEIVFDAWVADSRGISSLGAAKQFFPSPYESLAGLPLCEGAVQCSQPTKEQFCAQRIETRKTLTMQRPTHHRIDSSMASSVVVKRAEWVYSRLETELHLRDVAHIKREELNM